MSTRDIVVIGASAGGVEALMALVHALPEDLPASVFIVQHVSAGAISSMPAILTRAGRLPAGHAIDGERIQPGRIYIAPPDRHLLVHHGYVRVVRGPRENHSRPAIDPLFRSAALAYTGRVIGVVLTGALDDGSAGLATIKRLGGIAMVQDPEEALVRSMPEHALAMVDVDYCLGVVAIAQTIVQLSQSPAPEEGAMHMPPRDGHDLAFEGRIAAMELASIEDDGRPGSPSQFGCPECGGVLWERDDVELLPFRCRVGHAYSAATLLESQSNSVEVALWSALRALEEKASLTRRLIERAGTGRYQALAGRYQEQLRDTEREAATIRELLLNGPTYAQGSVDGPFVEAPTASPEAVS